MMEEEEDFFDWVMILELLEECEEQERLEEERMGVEDVVSLVMSIVLAGRETRLAARRKTR